MEEKIKQVMADILDMEPSGINDDTSMDNVEGWDSANHISLVLALEEEFDVAFDVSEIEEMTSFYSIVETVMQKK